MVGGVLLKVFLLWRASSFDGTHQYIVEVENKTLTKGEFLIFSPSTHTITTVMVHGKVDNGFSQYLALPADAVVISEPSENVTKLLQDTLFARSEGKLAPTSLDSLRLLLFAGTVSSTDFKHQDIVLPIDAQTSETLLPSLFLDKTLYNDNESIAIINATGEAGVGNTVAHMLTSIGMNVVSVTTADTNQDTSLLSAARNGTYTVARVSHILRLRATTSKNPMLSDITLTIGKDLLPAVQ